MLLVLVLVGAVGGFVAGLVGVGGGVIFGPALFFAFQSAGIEDPVLTPLTLGSSLLCTFAASASGTVAQLRAGSVDRQTALVAGGFAAVAVVLTGRFVATQPWYDKNVFQVLLAALLGVVVVRMLRDRTDAPAATGARRGAGTLGAIGAAAGSLASLAGIGGGVVLVPLFNAVVRLPMKVASGTSTAAITIITAVGVVTYAVLGLGQPVPGGALGYVDWRGAAALAVPAVVTPGWACRRRTASTSAPSASASPPSRPWWRRGWCGTCWANGRLGRPLPPRPMRFVGLACLLALGACAPDDGPADVTVEGVDPVQTDGDLAPDAELAPESQLEPTPSVAPERRSNPGPRPSPTLRPASSAATCQF